MDGFPLLPALTGPVRVCTVRRVIAGRTPRLGQKRLAVQRNAGLGARVGGFL